MPPPDDDQGSMHEAGREPSVVRDTAADVADALRGVAEPFVDDAVSRVAFALLALLMVPVGIVIVAVGFVAMAMTYSALGSPTGAIASAITIVGLLGILAALFFSFRALYRRMPRRLRAPFAAPMRPAAPDAARAPVSTASYTDSGDTEPPGRPPSAPTPTLAELDARLAPPPTRQPEG